MRINLPPVIPRYDPHAENARQEALVRALVPVVTTDEAVPYVHLQAPDGGVWQVTVTDAGVLTAVKVQG